MAHGGASDIVFLLLLAASIQWWFFPGSLYAADGAARTADTDELVKLGASLLLTIGFIFSTVKWNPINGKVPGIGGLIAVVYTVYSTFVSEGGDGLAHYLFYLYAAIILGGVVHIAAFPSNPLVKNTATPDGGANNHGNTADKISVTLLILSLLCLFWPGHLFQSFGPVQAQFAEQTAGLSLLIKFVAGLLMILATMLYGVKWDPINGKMSGAGCFIISLSLVYNTFAADSNSFVPCVFYLYAAVIFCGGVHIAVYPSNPRILDQLAEEGPSGSQTVEAGAAPLV